LHTKELNKHKHILLQTALYLTLTLWRYQADLMQSYFIQLKLTFVLKMLSKWRSIAEVFCRLQLAIQR